MCGWFGHQQNARVAVWLEIDRASIRQNLLDAKETREALALLKAQRRAEEMHEPGTQIIPGFEACHKGPIPLVAVADVLLIYQLQHHRKLSKRLGKPDNDTIQQIDAFEATLPDHKDDPIVRRHLAGRQRALAKHSEE